MRNFDQAHVRFGSVASHPDLRDAPGMSAMPPIATQSVRRNEASRCATKRNYAPQETVTLRSPRRRDSVALPREALALSH